jgi:hypothetical protein
MVRRISCEFHAFNQGESCPDCHAINYPPAEKPQPCCVGICIKDSGHEGDHKYRTR